MGTGGVTAGDVQAETPISPRAESIGHESDCTGDPHVRRHARCKNPADSGARLEVIAALAGHESLETTRRYVEPGQDDLAAAGDRLAGGQE